MDKVVNAVAGVFVALFVVVWLVVCWRLVTFTPEGSTTALGLSDAVITTAGFLATTVGAGTAAVLGIKAQEVRRRRLAGEANAKIGRLVVVGVLAYLVVGAIVLCVWLANSGEAPDLFKAFALGFLGWAAGAFSAVFQQAA